MTTPSYNVTLRMTVNDTVQSTGFWRSTEYKTDLQLPFVPEKGGTITIGNRQYVIASADFVVAENKFVCSVWNYFYRGFFLEYKGKEAPSPGEMWEIGHVHAFDQNLGRRKPNEINPWAIFAMIGIIPLLVYLGLR